MFDYCVQLQPMASGNDPIASSILWPSFLSYGGQLSPEWKAVATSDHRIYFVNHRTRSTHWFPPPEFWTSKLSLPYGWEAALDSQNKKYYINHVTRTTTREDPRSEADQATHIQMTPAQARRIELIRDETIGFGFVAGSEKPVVIRSVIPEGPSFSKLYANDEILKVNGKDVTKSPQADVISLIKSSVGRIELEVIASEDVQDTKNKHDRKSSLMSRTTRERRRSTPVSVRFADEPALVQVIGPKEPVRRSSVPLIPNVLKVFLENGQTRSFRYDCNTTTEEIFRSFASKLGLRLMEHFSLVLTGPKKGQISYIQNHEKISEIYTNRNCSSVNCLCKLNIAFVPKDHFELFSQDPNTFEYLYAQVTSTVVEGFYGMDLKYDLAIKLAALEMQQKAIEAAAGRPVKMSVRQIEKEFGGLNKFVSCDLLNNMKAKELRKGLDQQIKHNENLASPGEKHMSSLQCKIHYLNLAAEIFSYGGRYFDALLVDSGNHGPSLKKSKNQQITVLVNLKYGVSQVVRGKVNVLCQLAEFHEIKGFKISRSEDNKRLLCIRLQEGKEIQLICTSLACTDMIALITGYYKVYVDNTSNTPLPVENEEKRPFSLRRDPPSNDAPEFYSRHHVVPDVWSYPSCFSTFNVTNKRQEESVLPLNGHKDLYVDLSRGPPGYQQTAISEGSAEDHLVAEEVEQRKFDQDSVNKTASQTLNSHLCKGSAEDFDEDDSLDFVLTQDDYSVREKASFVLKTSTENIDRVTHKTQPDVSNGYDTLWASDELVESRKRCRSSLAILDKEASDLSDIKSAKTAVGDDLQLDKVDLATKQILREEIRENENTGATAFDESEGEVSVSDTESLRSVSTDGSNSERVFSVKSDQINSQAVDDCDEKDGDDNIKGTAGPLSYKHDSSQYRRAREEEENAKFVDSDLLSHPEPLDMDSSISCMSEAQTSIVSKCHENDLAFSEDQEQENLHSHPDQHLFISTDLVDDRITTTSEVLERAESTQHNNEIELMDCKEDESGSGGFHDQETSENCGHFYNTDPGEENLEPKELQLIDREGSENDISNKHQDLNSLEESEPLLVALSEFVESGNSETASEISNGEESLFSAFPEFFQPSERLTFSGAKTSVLALAEEDQLEVDMGDLNSMEPDPDLVPVSLIKFHSKDDLDTLSPLDDIVDAGFAKDWEELSTTSSENTDFSYEVNPELTSQTSDKDYCSFLNYHEEKQQVFEHPEARNDLTPVSLMPLNDTRGDILLETHSCWNEQEIRVEKSSHTFAADKAVSSDDNLNLIEKDCITDTSEVVEEQNALLKSSSFNYPSSNQSLRTWMDTGSRFSPSAWIIPSPPTPTPELQEGDIRIVSPPPVDTVTYDDELETQLEHLIVPPPPLAETVDTISNIRIASPPPSPLTQIVNSSKVIDDLVCECDEIRFLSLTDDHKLAHNKGLRVNFTEDRKIQTQNVEANGLFVSKGNLHASKSAPLICGAYTDSVSTKSYSVAAVEQKPPVPPKPLYVLSTNNESRAKECDAISYKDMDASSNAKRVVTRGGILNMARTRREPGQSLNPLHTKAGHSFSLCQIHDESFLKDSNNNDKSPVQSQSLQTSSKVLVEVKESDPSGDFKCSECEAELSLDSVVAGDSMSAAKGRSTAFHQPCAFSALATEDLLTRKETGEQGDTNRISSGLRLLHRSQKNPSSYSLTRLQHPFPFSKKAACHSLPNKHSVHLDEDVNDNLLLLSIAPRMPDSPPPPLPSTSPPKTIVDLNDYYDFDFGEPLSDTYEDYAQSIGDCREENSFDRPSSARELKSRRSVDHFSRKRGSSIKSLLKTDEKICVSTYYITPSSIRGVNRRSLSADKLHLEDEMTCTSKSKSPSLGVSHNEKLSGVSDSRLGLHFLEEHQTNSLETKCFKVFEEALSRVGSLRKRLESFLTENVTLKSPDETMNWLLVLQNNARFLACDVKVIVSSSRRGSGQVLSAIQASLESLEKLIEACEKANRTRGEYSTYNFHTLVSTMIEVVEHYGDVIETVKVTVHDQPNKFGMKSLNEKANVLETLIASLIRNIRKS